MADARMIVTGASRGIGRALVELALRRRMRVVAVGRDAARLRALAEAQQVHASRLRTVVADVTVATERQRIIDTAVSAFGGIDILVNNAGIGAMSFLEESTPEVLRTIFETNFVAAAEMIRLSLPWLRQGRAPAIVNISSVLGKRAVPGQSAYCASKFALQGFSDAIRAELRRDGIEVIVINPGITATEIGRNNLEHKTAWPTIVHARGVSPQSVAAAVLWSLRHRRSEMNLTLLGRFLVLASRLFPRVVDLVIRRQTRRHVQRLRSQQPSSPPSAENPPSAAS